MTVRLGFIFLFLFVLSRPSLAAQDGQVVQSHLSKKYLTHSLIYDGVNFHIHFPVNKNDFRKKIVEVIQSEFEYFHQYFDYRPQGDVHFLIVSAMESNGLAKVFPYNMVILNDYPPLAPHYLSNTTDWIKQLVVHEYIHILTMDMTRGPINKLRYIFGSMVKTNAVIPRWLAEGVAVWAESLSRNVTNKEPVKVLEGRANHQGVLFDVYNQLKSDSNCNSISCLDEPQYYPYGNLLYWVGGTFLQYLETTKKGAISCIFKNHSDGIPFLLNSIFEVCVGQNVEKSFQAFRTSFMAKNSHLESYCPLNSGRCQKLKKKNLLVYTDWQKGTCGPLVIIRKYSSSGPLMTAHTLYDLETDKIIKTDYTINRLMQVGGNCLVSLFKRQGRGFYREFYVVKNSQLILQKKLRNSDQVVNFNNVYYPLNYKDGNWSLLKDNDRVIVSEKSFINSPKLMQEKFEFVDALGQKNEIKLDEIKDKKTDFITSKSTSTSTSLFEIKDNNTTLYNPLKYLKPSYWYFLLSNISNLNRVNLMTSLSDPLERHRLDLQYDFYEHVDVPAQSGGGASYSYRQDLYRWSVGYNKNYSLSLFNSEINSSQFGFISFYRLIQGDNASETTNESSLKFSHSFGVTLAQLQLKDFISDRNSTQIELLHDLKYNSAEIRSFVTSMSLRTRLLQNKVQGFDDFYGLGLALRSHHYLTNKLLLQTSVSWGKYFKDDLVRGYFSGGGFSSFLTGNVRYPYYGVNQGNIFGNEIQSTRVLFGQHVKDLFWGGETTPLFLRYLNLNFGLEHASSKYIAIGDQLYVDDYTQGLLVGLSLNAVMFYGLPADFHIMMTQMIHPQQNTGLLIYFNASLF